MGACHHSEIDQSSVTIPKLNFITPIGRGSFGQVWRAQYKSSKQDLAVKVFIKSKIPSKEALFYIHRERSILSRLQHPFIINIHFAFQDKRKLYLGLDLKLGGDLRFHMLKRSFSEPEIKFVFACVLQAMTYIHSQKIIHKDLKPENIIFDSRGYAFLTDFGTASVFEEENGTDTAGTPAYMAPEIICRQPHSFVSDFFSLGVILYETILGARPYRGRNRKEIREKMLEKQAKIRSTDITTGWSSHSINLCNKLLKRKPCSRIGAIGITEILQHPWFADIDFNQISEFQAKPPFCPDTSQNYDIDQVNSPINKLYSSAEKLDSKDFLGYLHLPSCSSQHS